MTQEIPNEFEMILRQQFEELFERERDTIVKTALRWCFNHHQNAEDCVDEAFTRLWHLMARCGQAPPSPLGWLYKTARRVEIDRARAAFVRHGSVERMNEIASPEPATDAELIEDLLLAMEQLPARYRRAVSLKYLEQYRYAEIAEDMNCTIEAVRQILPRALNILRRRLAHHAPILRTSQCHQDQCVS